MSVELPFTDREEAGKALAKKLKAYARKRDSIVLGLVRGGMVTGREIASALHLPLHPYVVRKIGHPEHREFGLGAIAEGGGTYLDETAMHLSGVEWSAIELIVEEEMEELSRRRKLYRSPPFELSGKTVILTDDGAATGSTLLAAIRDMRKVKVKEVIIALPVAPRDTVKLLEKRADRVVILATPKPFRAVGEWYGFFPQVDDEEVLEILANARK